MKDKCLHRVFNLRKQWQRLIIKICSKQIDAFDLKTKTMIVQGIFGVCDVRANKAPYHEQQDIF